MIGETRLFYPITLRLRTSFFLLSATTLIFEITLSRVFSVTQFYHFSFMIVSLALLGFGASGTFLAIFPRIGRNNPSLSLGVLSLGNATSILGAYILVNKVPFDSFSMAWDQKQIGIFALHYFVLALPFFFSGTAVGLLLDIYHESAGKVYATNLIGSSMGCLGALVASSLFGGEGTMVLSSGIAVLAGILALIPLLGRSLQATAAALLVGIVLLVNLYGILYQVRYNSPLPIFELNISPYKALSYALQHPEAETISLKWNAFSRVDVVSSPGIRSMPGISFRYTAPPPAEYGLLVDGDNLNPVILPNADFTHTEYLLEAVAFQLKPNAKTLLLEPGGGFDLFTALSLGAQEVTVVEPNPLIIEAVYHYTRPGVNSVQETGRSFLQRSQQQYDIVQFSLTENYHPVRSGAYSLIEDYNHTQEAYHDALSRLEEDGILILRRWLQMPPSEFLRSFILAVVVLEQNGLDPGEHLVAIRSYNAGLLMIKKSPFSTMEIEAVRSFCEERAFDLVYLPGIQLSDVNRFNILEEPFYFKSFVDFLSSTKRQAWLDAYPYEVTPPTDNHPFFGHYFKWSQAPEIIAELGKSWQPFGGAGYFVLLVLLAFAIVMAGLIILLPLAFIPKKSTSFKSAFPNFVYFGLIGLGFLLVEIPLVQHLILYLGHPAYALTTALFSILLFSGIGSQNSARFSQRNVIAGLIVAILISPWFLDLIFDVTLGYKLFFRGLVAIIAIAPLGFLMGIPFPSGVTRIEATAQELIPWVWGVNGAFSVISSILAALIALSFGFSFSMLAGAACYGGALVAAKRLGSRVL
jgi:hypothetical protein